MRRGTGVRCGCGCGQWRAWCGGSTGRKRRGDAALSAQPTTAAHAAAAVSAAAAIHHRAILYRRAASPSRHLHNQHAATPRPAPSFCLELVLLLSQLPNTSLSTLPLTLRLSSRTRMPYSLHSDPFPGSFFVHLKIGFLILYRTSLRNPQLTLPEKSLNFHLIPTIVAISDL